MPAAAVSASSGSAKAIRAYPIDVQFLIQDSPYYVRKFVSVCNIIREAAGAKAKAKAQLMAMPCSGYHQVHELQQALVLKREWAELFFAARLEESY